VLSSPPDGKIWFAELGLLNGLTVSDFSLGILEQYVKLLEHWNSKVNLISRQDEQNIWAHHILGSVGFVFQHRFEERSLIADLGTGGGLPGIPLAILFPDLEVIMIDSIQKKIKAVSEMVSALHLKNARAVAGRAEVLSQQKQFAQKFDYVIARAVAPAKKLITWAKPLMTPATQNEISENPTIQRTGHIPRRSVVMLKGGDLSMEIKEAEQKNKPCVIKVHPIVIEGLAPLESLTDKKLLIFQA